ncbi:hypothetical protein C7J99_06995 [Brevibacillus brevis]|nr:hypothetical protein C7J99_06995 [Brevibacillus brevis]
MSSAKRVKTFFYEINGIRLLQLKLPYDIFIYGVEIARPPIPATVLPMAELLGTCGEAEVASQKPFLKEV